MKKIAVFLLMLLVVSCSAFAEDVEYEIRLSHNEQHNAVSAQIYITKGNSIAGHIGVSYNSDKLYSVTSNFESIPGEVPETGDDGASYLCSVVKSPAEYIIVTPEMVKVKELVNAEKSRVLFGWYAHKDKDSIKAGEEVASIFFKLNDGVDISDITTEDIVPATKQTTEGITGWGSGIMVADSAGSQYFYEPADDELKVKITVKADFIESTEDKAPEAEQPEEELPEETPEETPEEAPDVNETDKSETENNEQIEDNKQDEKENGGEALFSTDLSMVVSTFGDKIRVVWNKPDGFNVREYRIFVTDMDNDVVRIVEGITDVTRSFTVKNLANDYEFKVKLAAVSTDGSEVFHNKVAILKTKSDISAQAKIYNVEYDGGMGALYGLDTEQVVFGYTPTKAPVVYAPEGYEFLGWSVDGKTVIDLGKVKIYEDTVLKAVYKRIQ